MELILKKLCKSAVAVMLVLPAIHANAQYTRWHAGVSYTDTNIKYVSKTVIAYKASDSTLADKKLDYKEVSTFNERFDQSGYVRENGNGKKLELGKYKYDALGNLLGYIMYDSTGKVSSSVDYIYDSQGRLSSYTNGEPLFAYTYNNADTGKQLLHTYHYSYDFAGNIIAVAVDSAGVPNSVDSSWFNKDGQEIVNKSYVHNKLQSVEYTVHEAKGGYTTTNEEYYDASGNSCSPKLNRTVTKYDKDDNELSSISTMQENGQTTTTKTISKYKFEKGKMMSVITVTEETGDSHTSKTTDSYTYKYDQNGNQIESVGKGYSGNSLTRTTFNRKNKEVQQVTYGSCIDKPQTILTYAYYPNDTVMKEMREVTYDYPSSSIIRYNEHSETTESISRTYDGKVEQLVYTYEYWKK